MVGNSVNYHVEMSADIASIPSWKIALLERKRLHDKELSGSNVIDTPIGPSTEDRTVVDSSVPAWKRDILARKQNQKNSSVFLAKRGQSDGSHLNDTVTSINNGHVHSLCCGVEPELDDAVVDIDINDAAEDQPVEEHLLPIHQNPILRLDLKKRHQSSSSSSRSSMSPRVTSASSGSRVHSSALSSSSSQAPVTPDAANEEVFSGDNDCETEVAYGKGFVHKLLMKFSHLTSSSSDQTPNNRYPKQRFSSTGSQRQASRDLESISSKPSSGMPTSKFHSADDLLHETNFQVRIDHSDSSDELDITVSNDINGEYSSHLNHSDVGTSEDDTASKRYSSCVEVTEELPFANIVSSARSLFESLAVHSASQKQSTSATSVQNTTASRFPYIGTLERSKQPKSTSTAKTSVPEVITPKKFDSSYSSLNESAKSAAEMSHLNGIASVACNEESQRTSDAIIEHDVDTSEQESANRTSSWTAVSSPSSPSSTLTYGRTSNRDVNISATKLSQPASTDADLSTGKNDVSVLSTLPKEQEHDTIPTASVTQCETGTHESPPFTNDTRSWTVMNVSTNILKPIHTNDPSQSSQLGDYEENVQSKPVLSGKKPAPLRPGKLVIRPASNLVAAKTSSEYLEMTKFNDVRKGEFAPPLKKERIDPDMYDDDIDKVDGITDDSVITEDYVFAGAGVIIGRSLLAKTNRNKSVNTEYLFIM